MSKLETISLFREYPTPTTPLVVLKDVNLSLSSPQNLAIVGPSGSGKSTLLNILGALDRPTSGTVKLDDQDPFTLTDKFLAHFRNERVGFVFQDHHLLPQCTALENVLLPALPRGMKPDDSARAADLLEKVGLSDRKNHLPSELSGGERQRVAIARALINNPAILLCDEPTGNLDAASAQIVGELLLSVAKQNNAMLIVVTHSMDLASRFERRQRMNAGTLTPE